LSSSSFSSSKGHYHYHRDRFVTTIAVNVIFFTVIRYNLNLNPLPLNALMNLLYNPGGGAHGQAGCQGGAPVGARKNASGTTHRQYPHPASLAPTSHLEKKNKT